MSDQHIAQRVARRFSFKYEPKETKQHRVEALGRRIHEATGLSKGMSESIADALVRGREVLRLAIQKGWPISDGGVIEGPNGTLSLDSI
jgi:hypothetical protein